MSTFYQEVPAVAPVAVDEIASEANHISTPIPASDPIKQKYLRIDVDLSLKPQNFCCKPAAPKFEALASAFYETIFASSHSAGEETLLSDVRFLNNQFIAAANEAFNRHCAFVLSPAQLYLLILQQVSGHVGANSKELKSQFLNTTAMTKAGSSDEKIDLFVEIPLCPSKDNWMEAIQQMQTQIRENTIPDVYNLFSIDHFECSTLSEQIAGHITLMNTCKNYFSYYFMTLCGIPYFLLEGSKEDWLLLQQKTVELLSHKILPRLRDFWLPALTVVLEKIIAAYDGERDVDFWNCFYKRDSTKGSGRYTYISGWINCFFPFQKESKPVSASSFREREPTNDEATNPFCEPYMNSLFYRSKSQEEIADGLDHTHMPSGVTSTSAKWIRLGEEIDLSVCSGFIGFTVEQQEQGHGGAIRPEVGWWVGRTKPSTAKERFYSNMRG